MSSLLIAFIMTSSFRALRSLSDASLPVGRDIRADHPCWIDNSVEFVRRREAEFQRGGLQREVVIHRVVRDLGRSASTALRRSCGRAELHLPLRSVASLSRA